MDREGIGVIGLNRGNLGAICDKEALAKGLTHGSRIVGANGGCNEEGGDVFDGATFPPRCSFPKVLRHCVVEEVMCPGLFGVCDGFSKGANSLDVGLTVTI